MNIYCLCLPNLMPLRFKILVPGQCSFSSLNILPTTIRRRGYYRSISFHHLLLRSTGWCQARMMSSDTAIRKFEWLVVVPDYPGVQDKRMEIRPIHFANLGPAKDSGLIKMGGALLNDVPKNDNPESLAAAGFAGSTLVMTASSREEIIEYLSQDVYSKSGVWDLTKVQIWPFKCAFRLP